MNLYENENFDEQNSIGGMSLGDSPTTEISNNNNVSDFLKVLRSIQTKENSAMSDDLSETSASNNYQSGGGNYEMKYMKYKAKYLKFMADGHVDNTQTGGGYTLMDKNNPFTEDQCMQNIKNMFQLK